MIRQMHNLAMCMDRIIDEDPSTVIRHCAQDVLMNGTLTTCYDVKVLVASEVTP